MKPLRDDLIVDPLYDPDKVETGLSPGAPGLYVPDPYKNPMSQQGTVVASGNSDVEEGDHVLYHPFIGSPFRVNGYEYLRIESRHLAGFLDADGSLWPLPGDVALRPIFSPAGRPILEGSLWVPKQLHHTDVPCAGVILRVGERAGVDVHPGEVVLFPPNRGNEIGLRKVYYTIHGSDLLAKVGREVYATIQTTPAWWQSPPTERYRANHSNK